MLIGTHGRRALLAMAAICGLSGCANLQTVSRSSSVPFGSTKGRAVHLDAQQRLVVFAAEKYCAEPSPDALAAYASALGISGSRLPSESIAASGALSSMAGSIGLRTQSITLMRDTLYRTCEASLNKTLSASQVAVLMARSQDLTAVILAIEQLTGAVAAPSITLAGSGNASAAATIMANTQALEQARALEAEAKKVRDAAETKKDQASTEYKEAQKETESRRAASLAKPGTVELETALIEQQKVEDAKRVTYDEALSEFTLKDNAYTNRKKAADDIEALQDASSNTTTAGIGGTSHAGTAIVYPGISKEAAKQVATTTRALVEALLKKSYFHETCLAILTEATETQKTVKNLQELAVQQRTAANTAAADGLSAAAATLLISDADLKKVCLDHLKTQGNRAL